MADSTGSLFRKGSLTGSSCVSGLGNPGWSCLPYDKPFVQCRKQEARYDVSTFRMTHVKVSCDKPTGQYDSSFPCLRSSAFASSKRAQLARLGRRKLIMMCTKPAESYIAGAYRGRVTIALRSQQQKRTPSAVIPIHLSMWPLGTGNGFAWNTSKSSKDINVAINPCDPGGKWLNTQYKIEIVSTYRRW